LVLNEIAESTQETPSTADIAPQLPSSLQDLPRFHMAPSTAPDIPPGVRVIDNPRGLDDAMDKALRIVRRDSGGTR
jgi:hypothetical protein